MRNTPYVMNINFVLYSISVSVQLVCHNHVPFEVRKPCFRWAVYLMVMIFANAVRPKNTLLAYVLFKIESRNLKYDKTAYKYIEMAVMATR